MRNGKRPTGIIRTLPGQAKTYEFGKGRDRMMRSYEAMRQGKIDTIMIALAHLPTKEVLHLYVLVGGEIVCRMNIVEFQSGKDFELKCFMNTHAFQPGDSEHGWEKQCSVIAPDGLRHCGGYRADHPMQAVLEDK